MAETKRCPNCNALATINDLICQICGHHYISVAPREVKEPAQHVPPPPMPPAAEPAEPIAQLLPEFDPTRRQPNLIPEYVLDECTRQYKNLTIILILGIFFTPAAFVGLILLAYAVIQRPALRRRVAELGYDPRPWAAPIDSWIWKSIAVAVGLFFLLVAGLFALDFAISASESRHVPSSDQSSYGSPAIETARPWPGSTPALAVSPVDQEKQRADDAEVDREIARDEAGRIRAETAADAGSR